MVGEISGKVWGSTKTIYADQNVCVNLINVIANGYCSIHKHCHKYNLFYVLSGELEIDVQKTDYDLIDTTIIQAGETTIVQPGEFHQFVGLADTIALEIYWTELTGDIYRKSSGGADYTADIGALLKMMEKK